MTKSVQHISRDGFMTRRKIRVRRLDTVDVITMVLRLNKNAKPVNVTR
jgi:hypothetical protein